MTDYVPPCASPERDPEDWFIERDGRQHPEDEYLTEAERQEIADAVVATVGEKDPDLVERIDDAVNLAEEHAKRDALRRRRHARDSCHVDCYMRLKCLTIALSKPEPTHGTWGGYYPEELKQIRQLRDKRARSSHQTDSPSEG